MNEVCNQVAAELKGSGPAVLACKQADIQQQLYDDSRMRLARVSEKNYLIKITEENKVQLLREFRQQELGWLYKLAQTSVPMFDSE
jgi:hypothetical protein